MPAAASFPIKERSLRAKLIAKQLTSLSELLYLRVNLGNQVLITSKSYMNTGMMRPFGSRLEIFVRPLVAESPGGRLAVILKTS